MFRRYLKNTCIRFILSCVIAWCLTQMCFLGFYIPAGQQQNMPMLLAIVIILTAVLWLISYGKRTAVIGIIAIAAAAAIALIWLRASGNFLKAFSDKKDSSNPYLYFIICFVVIIGVWLLTATKKGTFVLLMLGIFVAAIIQFLYHDNRVLWLVLFLIATIVNLALQNYRLNLLHSKGRQLSFAATAGAAAVCAAVMVLLGSLAFAGIVQPIHPPRKHLYLLEQDMNHKIVDQMGLAKTVKVLDPNLKSNKTQDKEQNKSKSGQSGKKKKDSKNKTGGSSSGTAANKSGNQQSKDKVNPIHYPPEKNYWFLLPIIIAAAVVAAILLKIRSRSMWLRRMQKKSRSEQISALYHRFLSRFKRIGEGKMQEETPYEYADRNREKLAEFDVTGTSFRKMTAVFVRSTYGQQEVSDEDYGYYLAYYKQLPAKLRKHLGLRYLFKFFIL